MNTKSVHKTLLFLCLALLSGLYACVQEGDIGYVDYQPLVAVDGKIESGGRAFVLLAWTSSFNQELDTTYLLEHVIKSATVIVRSDTQEEILTLGTRPGFIPPYAYYGSEIVGEPGKKYTLEINYQGRVISAETYIPEPVPLQNYWFEKARPQDTTGYVHIRFEDNPSQQRYYQACTMVSGKETVYTPCLYGNWDNSLFGEKTTIEMQINKGPVLYPKTSFTTSFVTGNEIKIQFKTMTKEAYDFWNSWQNEVLNAQNPVFPAQTNLASNIQGGVGIWSGYGVQTYTLRVPR